MLSTSTAVSNAYSRGKGGRTRTNILTPLETFDVMLSLQATKSLDETGAARIMKNGAGIWL